MKKRTIWLTPARRQTGSITALSPKREARESLALRFGLNESKHPRLALRAQCLSLLEVHISQRTIFAIHRFEPHVKSPRPGQAMHKRELAAAFFYGHGLKFERRAGVGPVAFARHVEIEF